MTPLDNAIIEVVNAHRLDQVLRVSKDDLDHQAERFVAALEKYAKASQEAFRLGDLSVSDGAANRFQLVAVLYSPGLISALAGALLRMAEEQ